MPDELANYIFKDMSSDTFLQAQYERLLVDYVRSRFGVAHTIFDDNYRSLLRYADLLSISDSEVYNNLAQQIVILLGELFPDEDEVKLFKESVYQNVSNYASLEYIKYEQNIRTQSDFLREICINAHRIINRIPDSDKAFLMHKD